MGILWGISEPEPETVVQQVVGLGVMLCGVLVSAVVVGTATTVVADMHAQASEVSSRLHRIRRYTQHKRLPAPLCARIERYYSFQYGALQQNDETNVLVGLPRSLKLQLDLVVHAPIFVRLPLFRLCQPAEILLLMQRLTPALAMPGEAVVKEGEANLGLFFLMRGAVAVERRGRHVATMLATAAFGEQALLGGAKPTASVVALRFCEITVLLRHDFLQAIQLNPSILEYLQLYSTERNSMSLLHEPPRKAAADVEAARPPTPPTLPLPLPLALPLALPPNQVPHAELLGVVGLLGGVGVLLLLLALWPRRHRRSKAPTPSKPARHVPV